MKRTSVMPVQWKWIDRLPPLRLTACLALLTASMLVFLVPLGAVCYAWRGPDSLMAAAVAAGVCWLGAALTLVGADRFGRQGVNGPLFVLLLGMVFNCALPFATGLILFRQGGPLAQAGVFGLIVICFQFSLVLQTMLSVCLLKSPRWLP